MKKFKILGAKSLRGAIEYYNLVIDAENEEEARILFLRNTRFYDVLRIEEIS